MRMFCCAVLAGLCGVAGCALDLDSELATSSVSSAFTCGEFACGENGGMIAGVPFWGLWLSGAENEHHVRYLQFRNPGGIVAPLDVDGGQLRVWSGVGWETGPTALQGGILKISIRDKPYDVRIAEVRSGISGGMDIGEPFWTRIARLGAEIYRLQWAGLESPKDVDGTPIFQDVCPHETLDSALWKNQFFAVVFEGEKYDLHTRNITLPPTTPLKAWFNIACEGSLPAKMYLTMRTSASALSPSYVSTIENDRQALVRAYAAEYCGNGVSFTKSGHKLVIRDHLPIFDHQGWLPRETPIGWADTDAIKPEAVWDANGAVCLDTPRMGVDDLPKFPADGHIEQDIADNCPKGRPVRCSDQKWFPDTWTEHGLLMTATIP